MIHCSVTALNLQPADLAASSTPAEDKRWPSCSRYPFKLQSRIDPCKCSFEITSREGGDSGTERPAVTAGMWAAGLKISSMQRQPGLARGRGVNKGWAVKLRYACLTEPRDVHGAHKKPHPGLRQQNAFKYLSQKPSSVRGIAGIRLNH